MPDNTPLFITGIGTGIGKTIVSAVVTEKLKADYWKPIQSGDLHDSDTLKVRTLVSNSQSIFHPESYLLTQPYSPHKSAALDGISIDPKKIIKPETSNRLVIEGAGGLMVPLNDTFLMIDLIKQLDVDVMLISQNYLGSINHTLLSIFQLKQYNINIAGIVFNGNTDIDSEDYILKYTGVKLLGRLPEFETVNKEAIAKAGELITF
jgi:dethiobiotin synthetase